VQQLPTKTTFHLFMTNQANPAQQATLLGSSSLKINKNESMDFVQNDYFSLTNYSYSNTKNAEVPYCHSPTPIQPNSTQHEVGVTRLLVCNRYTTLF
jgi:hypothetical protein